MIVRRELPADAEAVRANGSRSETSSGARFPSLNAPSDCPTMSGHERHSPRGVTDRPERILRPTRISDESLCSEEAPR
jgi:hypothetical protein